MEFNLQSRNAEHAAGLTAVVALHVLLGLALMYGLAVSHPKVSPPKSATWITPEIIKPAEQAPPPEKVTTRMPDIVIVPLPEIPDAPVIDRQVITPSYDANQDRAMPPGPATALTGVATNVLGAACPNAQSIRSTMVYPAQAWRESLQGDVLARFVVGAAGDIRNIQIMRSSNRAFNAAVIGAVQQLHCVAQGQDVLVEMPFSFRLE